MSGSLWNVSSVLFLSRYCTIYVVYKNIQIDLYEEYYHFLIIRNQNGLKI